jgi:carbamoyl-phosphate synthase large subunit
VAFAPRRIVDHPDATRYKPRARMPRRSDLKSIFLIGSGPIVIGQACEFDYSGAQAVKALREEGYRVILLNSNPATIMTDPNLADRTYIEPMTVEAASKIIEQERPDALLPTLGGQTALNLAVALAESGVLEKYGVRLIGASLEAIKKSEDRELFKQAMQKIGVALPMSGYATTLDEARAAATKVGFPNILRPSFTLGGAGGAIAYDKSEFDELASRALAVSPTHTLLVEESVLGWKEFELEVMRDRADNVVIICSIENLDPMGVHTGDSITVAPAQTLTDKEYQRMRDLALAIIREIGVDTGGSNIQFAINPDDGRIVVIEMNPRVSRSSALASKATGFPIAKIAAKLAVGFTLDEIRNDITRETPASFEPTIDYVVTKVPRFAFEKFPKASRILNTQMKSVGEVMAMGRTFKESLQKALRSLEIGRPGLISLRTANHAPSADEKSALVGRLQVPGPDRLWHVADALRSGFSVGDVAHLTRMDPWFLREIADLVEAEHAIAQQGKGGLSSRSGGDWKRLKSDGFSDKRLAQLTGADEEWVRAQRHAAGTRPVFKRVDTCAAEFEAYTPYLYSTYEDEDEARPTDRQKVMILGGGPNRIGQGIEFDYCCVHAAFALRDAGFETIMVNCNPETVSTDYDTADRLYFEPLTMEDVLAVADLEKPLGLIVQFGGQTPLKLAVPLEKAGVRILGTTPDAIDIAEDRERFVKLIDKLGLKQAENGIARSPAEAFGVAQRIGYPVMVRPSYVLGGRAMEVVYDDASLATYMKEAVEASPEHPVLIDRFLRDAIEVDVDVVADKTGRVLVGGVMEHIEEAGVHSGDAACVLPPHSLRPATVKVLKDQAIAMARELGVVGLMNVQFAVQKGDDVYVLEANPRASRTVPFVSKATGLPLAKIASLCMVGKTLEELGYTHEPSPRHFSVKESVFPFVKFPGVDTILGPEMKSTGEVMGIDLDYRMAFAKSQLAAGNDLPIEAGKAFLSVRNEDKAGLVVVAQGLSAMGFEIVATSGTASYLGQRGIRCQRVNKVAEGHPNVVDQIKNGEISLVINTTAGRQEQIDSFSIRRETLNLALPYFTTIQAAQAAVSAMDALRKSAPGVKALQDYY